MRNKFKLKKKLASIALALVLAAQPLASLPMNVFAGTGKTGVITAPLKADFKELNKGQIVSSKYIVSKSVAFGSRSGDCICSRDSWQLDERCIYHCRH